MSEGKTQDIFPKYLKICFRSASTVALATVTSRDEMTCGGDEGGGMRKAGEGEGAHGNKVTRGTATASTYTHGDARGVALNAVRRIEWARAGGCGCGRAKQGG